MEGPRGAADDDSEAPTQVIGLVDAAMRRGSDQTLRTGLSACLRVEPTCPNVQVVMVDGRAVATSPVLPSGSRARLPLRGGDHLADRDGSGLHQHRGFGSSLRSGCIDRMEADGVEVSVLWTLVATFPFYELNG